MILGNPNAMRYHISILCSYVLRIKNRSNKKKYYELMN